MDIATMLGMIFGVGFIVSGILVGGIINDFYDLPSIFITLGGTFASTMINYSTKQFFNVFKVAKNAFKKHQYDLVQTIGRIIELANMARREGLLSLDRVAESIEEPFLRKGIMLIVDGTDPELVKNIMETELIFMEERHAAGQSMFESMAEYAPAYGMIGTLIGLINMLRNLNNADSIGVGMATALVTTFYGVILANLVFTPIAGKLRSNSKLEMGYNELILEGLLSIQAGENPLIIEEKLNSFVAKMDKENIAFVTAANEGGGRVHA
ncbi:MAG: motility protein A [Firmicutes bacterium]|nr:motility protein A [Bacillota bacterium]